MITADELRKLFKYDPATGHFKWQTDRLCGKGRIRRKAGDVAGRLDTHGYRRVSILDQSYAAHRLAWLYVTGEWPAEHIDHINGNRDDNRFENLRLASRLENNRNIRIKKTNKIGVKGVCTAPNYKGRYRARIVVNGKGIHLGYFNCPTAAHLAYCRAAKEHFGEFARPE